MSEPTTHADSCGGSQNGTWHAARGCSVHLRPLPKDDMRRAPWRGVDAASSSATRLCRREISRSFISTSTFISSMLRSLFTTGLFRIFLARVPKRSVDTVSSTLYAAGEQFMINAVRELPPSDSCSMRVNWHASASHTPRTHARNNAVKHGRHVPSRLHDHAYLGVAVWDVCGSAIRQRIDHVAERRQALVNVFGFFQLLALHASLSHLLATSQVHQVPAHQRHTESAVRCAARHVPCFAHAQLASFRRLIHGAALIDGHDEHRVAATGRIIHSGHGTTVSTCDHPRRPSTPTPRNVLGCRNGSICSAASNNIMDVGRLRYEHF